MHTPQRPLAMPEPIAGTGAGHCVSVTLHHPAIDTIRSIAAAFTFREQDIVVGMLR